MQLDDIKAENVDALHSAKQWQCVVAISRTMRSLAEKGNWEELIKLEVIRQLFIDCYFKKTSSNASNPAMAKDIQEIMEIDRDIIDRSRAAMDDLANQSRNIIISKKANRAYLKHSA